MEEQARIKPSKLKLNITWLYPREMSTYGDRGNVLTLYKRCLWRGIEAEVEEIGIGKNLKKDWTDIYFFGGGQDVAQTLVAQDLLGDKKKILKEEAEEGKVILGICGGYQLSGIYYRDFEGKEIEGLGILDVATRAGSKRMMGNLVVETQFLEEKLVGFENHSGKTKLGQNAKALGKVVVGSGNNGGDKTEGAIQNNVYGCYLHGPVLPKNPAFADYLLHQALLKKYGETELTFLNDSTELAAHEVALDRAHKTH
ncbi:MAG TPA: glutamine amidotransferase [Candidatus Saccharimonadales bacterium]|nr:glutamine amidotransferase [Candidatus Saccharimonadales bacterium]